MGDLGALLPEDPERIGVHILVGRLGQDPRQTVYLGHLPDDDTLRVIRVLAPARRPTSRRANRSPTGCAPPNASPARTPSN